MKKSEQELSESVDLKKEVLRIRKEFKTSFPSFRFSVRTEYFSGGQKLKVAILSGPVAFVINPAGWDVSKGLGPMSYQSINTYYPQNYHHDTLLKKMIAIINKNNFDKSDMRSDYHHVGFYLDLTQGKYDRRFVLTDPTGKKPINPNDKVYTSEEVELRDTMEEPIDEAVGIDGRTGAFRRTVSRLEHYRNKREEKNDKYKGMYDDGTGKGAIMPKPITFNKESKRFTVEIDARTKSLREAMKRVEMYRKLREEKKKVLLGGVHKESVEEISESTNLTKGQILDAVGMTNNKFEVTEQELSPKQKEYRAFFQKALKKFDADSPANMDDGEKKKFFDYVKANWKG